MTVVGCLRLLADDLTGALDSAACFVPLTGPVATVWHGADLPENAAIDSGTRELSDAEAQAAIARFAPLLQDGAPAFKKIDSLLRGHVALELAACARRFDHCILAPAFPAQGRITRDGRQLVRVGDVWHDTGVDLRTALQARGVDVRVHDAATDADLDAIVCAGRALPGRVLWCGTGGLASALAGRRTAPRPALPRPLLALIASDHPVSLAQLDAVRSLVHRVPPPDGLDRALARDGAAVAVCDLPSGMDRAVARDRIAKTFAALLRRVQRPGTLLVAGGETLRGLCVSLGVAYLEVDGQIAPGVPTSILRGGAWDGQRLVSKSGAFGDAGFLARVLGGAGVIYTASKTNTGRGRCDLG